MMSEEQYFAMILDQIMPSSSMKRYSVEKDPNGEKVLNKITSGTMTVIVEFPNNPRELQFAMGHGETPSDSMEGMNAVILNSRQHHQLGGQLMPQPRYNQTAEPNLAVFGLTDNDTKYKREWSTHNYPQADAEHQRFEEEMEDTMADFGRVGYSVYRHQPGGAILGVYQLGSTSGAHGDRLLRLHVYNDQTIMGLQNYRTGQDMIKTILAIMKPYCKGNGRRAEQASLLPINVRSHELDPEFMVNVAGGRMELIGVKASEEVIIRIYNTDTPWGYAEIKLQWYRGTTTRRLHQSHTGQDYRLAGVMFLHARAETVRYPIPPRRETTVPAARLTGSHWYNRQIPLIWRGVVDNLHVVRETFMYFPHKKQVITDKGPIERKASLEAIEREEAVCEQLLEGYYESIHQTGGPSALSFIYTLLRGDLAGWMHVIDRKSVEPLQEPNVQRPAAPPARQLQEEAPSAHAPIARIRGGGNPRGKTLEQIQKQSNAPPAIKTKKTDAAEPPTGAEDDRKMPAQRRGKSDEALDRVKARLGAAMEPARQLVVPGPVNPPPIHRMTEGTELVSLMDVMEQQAVDISEQQAIFHYRSGYGRAPQPSMRRLGIMVGKETVE